jgi:GNAT superfamily N-acetyltransferase
MKIRRSRAEDRSAWLELLDGWGLLDGWRGGAFFARPFEHDASCSDNDVWVAEDAGELVSTLQIFPRLVSLRGSAVPMGGIGSVFTREASRGAGIASRLLEAAVADMRDRGMEISLLFTGRLDFYARLGWRSWPLSRELLRPGNGVPAAGSDLVVTPFDVARDLEGVAALHVHGLSTRECVALRDAAAWDASLALAGNPAEEFVVARSKEGGPVLAYLRAARLTAALSILEHGQTDVDALAALCAGLLGGRAPDALASPDRPSVDLRGYAVLPFAADAELAAALEHRGVTRQTVQDPTAMLFCLDAPALAKRLEVELAPGEPPDAFLRRVLPPESFGYWPADRF